MPAPSPAAPGVTAPEPDLLAPPWLVRLRPGSWTRRVTLETELRTRTDTLVTVDSLRTAFVAEWTRLAADAEGRIAGLIREFSLSADSSAPVTPAGLLLPIPFAAELGAVGMQPRIAPPDPAACTLDAAASQPLRELLLSPPQRLEPGTAWSDSATTSICRDSIPLTVRSVRRFVVRDAAMREGGLVVRVERTSTVLLAGNGRQFGEPLTIAAEGEGRLELYLRVPDGVVVEGAGEQVLRMTMRGRRRSQELAQRTRITIGDP